MAQITLNSTGVASDGALALQSNGTTTAVTITTAQNVGIGTASPASDARLTLASPTTESYVMFSRTNSGVFDAAVGNNAGSLVFKGGADSATVAGLTEFMRIDSSGNVGIGTSSPGSSLHVSKTTTTLSGTGNGYGVHVYPTSSGDTYVDAITGSSGNTTLTFRTYNNGTYNNVRIDSSGNLLVGTTSSTDSTGVGFKVRPSAIGTAVTATHNTSGGFSTYHVYNINATNTGYRFYVSIDGGISNFSGNNVNLSDERTKKNIEVAGSYLDKICAIPVKLFNYKDEPENEQRTLGVIAQDVEVVAPELVNSIDGWQGTDPEDGVPLKTIYITDMMFALMKSIQEQQAIITQLQADVAALKGTA